jgi:hypothetical protein
MAQTSANIIVIFLTFLLFVASNEEDFSDGIDGTHSTVYRGYFKREHSLTKPYQGLSLYSNKR